MLQQAIQAFQAGNFDIANSILKRVLQIDKKSHIALFILGLIKAMDGDFKEAAFFLSKAASINPNDASIQYNLAKALSDNGKDKEAIPHHIKATILDPSNQDAWLNYGKTLSNIGKYDEAMAHYDKALALKPDYAEILSNKGIILNELKRYEEAIAHFDRALALKPDLPQAWSNKGNLFSELKRYDEAIFHYDKALALNPDNAVAWSNKGAVLNQLKRYDEAVAHYDKALGLRPDYAEAWSNKGNTLSELKQYDDAIAHYEKALSLKPDIDWVYGSFCHAKMKICSWLSFTGDSINIAKKILAKEKVIYPFQLKAMNDDPFLQKQAAQIFIQDKYPFNSTLEPILKRPQNEKIRIGYFSADFQNHPVSYLTSELFEIHNRHRFEVFAFSLQEVSADNETNLRLRKGFDKFLDVENIADKEIAQLARKLEIDIAIDLGGLTHRSRTGIFSYRAAPIQVNWLGYPGTIGSDFIDYIEADRTIIPDLHREFYVEKVAYLPDTYMVDDSQRVASSRVFTREECGLPENAFVFCCFNNDYKFNAKVLDSWSKIISATKNSVLWISENNKNFQSNIAIEFETRGIDQSRLIFAKRVELMTDHLARYSLADLFLDTHPYNAHTTAVDSLKTGIPVLTLMGQSFASRVAASLLNAIGLPELITSTQKEYEALAIELAMNPKKLEDIKYKLETNRLTAPLFNTPLFTKNLEAAYIKMMERYYADLKPEHIEIFN